MAGESYIASSGATSLALKAGVKAVAVHVQASNAHHWSTMLEGGVLVPLQESRARMRAV